MVFFYYYYWRNKYEVIVYIPLFLYIIWFWHRHYYIVHNVWLTYYFYHYKSLPRLCAATVILCRYGFPPFSYFLHVHTIDHENPTFKHWSIILCINYHRKNLETDFRSVTNNDKHRYSKSIPLPKKLKNL